MPNVQSAIIFFQILDFWPLFILHVLVILNGRPLEMRCRGVLGGKLLDEDAFVVVDVAQEARWGVIARLLSVVSGSVLR